MGGGVNYRDKIAEYVWVLDSIDGTKTQTM